MDTAVIILTLAYFVFAVFRLEAAAAGIAFLMPFYLVKATFLGVPFTAVELCMYAFFAASIVQWLKEIFFTKRLAAMFSHFEEALKGHESFRKKYGLLVIAMVVLVAAAFMSLFTTPAEVVLIDGQIFPGMRTAMGILKGWIIAPILFVLGVLRMKPSNRLVLKMFNAYMVSAVLLALWGLVQVVTQDFVTPDARASGPFESANYLALYIAPALFYIMVRIKQMLFPLDHDSSEDGWRKAFLRKNIHSEHPELLILLVFFLVLFVAFIGTKSYAAMMSLFGASIIYFGLEYREYRMKIKSKNKPWRLFFTLGIFAVLIGTIVFVSDPGKWQAMFQFDERNSSSVRLEVYDISWNLIKEHWFTGIGMGLYPAEYQVNSVQILGHEPYEWNMLHPHNLYLAFWLNLGLTGLLAFLFIIGICLQRVFPHLSSFGYDRIDQSSKLRVMGFCMLLLILMHGFFDTPFFKSDLAILFWLVVLCIMLPSKEGEHNS